MKTVLEIVKEKELLNGIALDVYQIISNSPTSLTVGEVFRQYKAQYPKTQRTRGELSKRVSELHSRKAISITETRKCGYSGHTASAYAATNSLPLVPSVKGSLPKVTRPPATVLPQTPRPLITHLNYDTLNEMRARHDKLQKIFAFLGLRKLAKKHINFSLTISYVLSAFVLTPNAGEKNEQTSK